MRKLLLAALTVLFLASSVSSVHAAPKVKVGAKCSKVNAKASEAGKKFICVKSGSKLTWKQTKAAPAAIKFGELIDGPCSKSQATLIGRHVTGQLTAISKKDWKVAYSFAAKSFQNSISEAEFAMIIESSYGLLITNKGYAFQDCEIFDGEVLQVVLIQDDLREVVYGYQLSYVDGQLGIVAASALAEGQVSSA
jgi:hypothetical protein